MTSTIHHCLFPCSTSIIFIYNTIMMFLPAVIAQTFASNITRIIYHLVKYTCRRKLREDRNQLLQFVLETFKDRVLLSEDSPLNYDQINVQSVLQSLKDGKLLVNSCSHLSSLLLFSSFFSYFLHHSPLIVLLYNVVHQARM